MSRHLGRFLVCVVSCMTAGCPSRDNPYDPGRCDPACAGGEVCFEGRCVPPDGGQLDTGPPDAGADTGGPDLAVDLGQPDATVDTGPDLGPAITYSVRPAGATSIPPSTPWTDIPGLAPQTVTANGKDKYLFILNVPGTSVNPNEGIGQYRIVGVNSGGVSSVLASGMFSGNQNFAVPITLVGAKQLPAGTHTIKGQWQVFPPHLSTTLTLGAAHATWLVVVRADSDDLQFSSGPSTDQILNGDSTGDGADISIPQVTAKVAGEYLLMLNAPQTYAKYGTGAGAWVIFTIADGSTGSPIAEGSYKTAFTDQHVPTSVVGVKYLAVGDKVKATWEVGGYTDATLAGSPDGVTDATWLIAMRVPTGIAHVQGTSAVSTTSTVFQEISTYQQSPVKGTSVGGNHLFIFNAAEPSVDAQNSWSSFQLLVDGSPLADGGFTTVYPNQFTPLTLVGVKDLPAGKQYNASVQWLCGSGTANMKANTYWLLGLTR